jgi:hypothetical protein
MPTRPTAGSEEALAGALVRREVPELGWGGVGAGVGIGGSVSTGSSSGHGAPGPGSRPRRECRGRPAGRGASEYGG